MRETFMELHKPPVPCLLNAPPYKHNNRFNDLALYVHFYK